MRKIFATLLVITLFWSCATYKPPPPAFNIESLPDSIVANLSLEERIVTEEAWTTLKEGRGEKATKMFSKLGIQSPFHYVGLGYAYLLANKTQQAEENFKRALKNYPDMILIHLGLAQLYQKTGMENLAFAEYREVLKREPYHQWTKRQYEALKNKKTKEALREGNDALSQGDKDKSKAAFLKALHYSPRSMEAHLTLAEIFRRENDQKKVLFHLNAALSNDPTNKKILHNYAETLYMAEHFSKSLDMYQKLLDLEPKNKEARDRIEKLKNRLGIFELPNQYGNISSSEAISKEEIAALLAVKFKEFIEKSSRKPPIIIDISTSWASKFILQMTSLNILDVLPNHTFQPKKIITRAEMAKILYRFIRYLERNGYKFIQQIPPGRIQVSDVTVDNYYYQPIILILSYNIMDLTRDRSFKPDLPVSGQESIKLLDIILALIK